MYLPKQMSRWVGRGVQCRRDPPVREEEAGGLLGAQGGRKGGSAGLVWLGLDVAFSKGKG